MRDVVRADQLVDAVGLFLKEKILPGLDPALAYDLRVSVNALALVGRALRQDTAATEREASGLRALLGDQSGDVDMLNAALCDRIAQGEIALDDDRLIAHLWSRAMDRLAIDQPGYSAYLRNAPVDAETNAL